MFRTKRPGPVDQVVQQWAPSWFSVIAQCCFTLVVSHYCFMAAAQSLFMLDEAYPSNTQYFGCETLALSSIRLCTLTKRFLREPLSPSNPAASTPLFVHGFTSVRHIRVYLPGGYEMLTQHLFCFAFANYSIFHEAHHGYRYICEGVRVYIAKYCCIIQSCHRS